MKKGQVTVFIVIGVLLLLGLIVFWSIRTAQEAPAAIKYEYEGQRQLDLYVKGCLQPAVLQGLEIMRLQGGYVDIPADTSYLLVRDIDGWTVREEGGSKKVVKGDGVNKAAYWVTDQGIQIPSIDYMANQLAGYVLKEASKCIGGLSQFKEQGYGISIEEPKADVSIGESVVTDLNYPITFKRQDATFTMDKFTFSVPINMKSIAEKSADMAFFEDSYAYLEHNTNNLISLFSGVDQNKLPPMVASRTNSDCSYVTWSKPGVSNSLKGILARNIPALKVKGTDYEPVRSSNLEYQGFYDSMVLDLFDGDNTNLIVDFSYRSDWDILLDVKPSFGDSIQPDVVEQTMIPFLPRFCILKYKFKYFLGYPVLIEIEDKDSARIDPATNTFAEKKGYKFQFPMWAVLYGNNPREYIPRTLEPEVDLAALSGQYGVKLYPETLFCKPEQRVSDDITVLSYDSGTNKEIGNVDIYYRCGPEVNTCFIGTTDEEGKLVAKFPRCINGFVALRKNGYASSGEKLTIFDEGERTLPYFLEQIKEYTFKVKAVNAKGLAQDYAQTGKLDVNKWARDLKENESAIISIPGIETPYILYPVDNKIKLNTGTYRATISVMGDVGIKEGKAGNETTPAVPTVPLGAYDEFWSIAPTELEGTKEVTFYVLVDKEAGDIKEFLDIVTDSVIASDGALSAELLYENGALKGIDGRYRDDFTGEGVKLVRIAKGDYAGYLRPRFS